METQPLVQPIRLELPNSALLSIKNNLEVFQKNGFQFLDEDKNSLDEGVYSSAIHLKTVPSIRNYKFDIEGNKKHQIYACLIFFSDINYLVDSCSDDAYSAIFIPKIRSSLASRACRTATMIGDALSQSQMSKIIANMATMEQPWNCPHGYEFCSYRICHF
jgi:DNA mismatch repair protein PMS2